MTAPLTDEERDRVFAQEFVRLDGADNAALIAYRRAGFFEPQFVGIVAAERQMARPEIQALIVQARANFKPKVKGEWTRESIVADFEKIYEGSLNDRDWNAATNAKSKQASLLGLVSENITVTHKMDVEALSDEQLLKIIKKSPVVVEGQFTDVTPKKGIGHLGPPDEANQPRTSS